MTVRLTPPLQTKGRYTVRTPFVASDTTIYTCVALRKFSDIVEAGEDVYTTYYLPHGVSEGDYRTDGGLGAVIVTLADPYGGFIYVPDTYIASYPNMGNTEYKHVVLGVSIGALPDYVPLENLMQGVTGLVSDMIGSENEVNIYSSPTRDQPTLVEHEAAEAARVAAITLRETDRALYLKEKTKNTALTAENQLLLKIIKDNGLLD